MPTDYDTLAGRYDEDRARFSVPRDDVIDELLGARAAVRVLDLGCGTGTWLAAHRARCDDARLMLLGIDPSSGMLREAQAKRCVDIVRAPAEELPLRNATIDYVVTSYSFHHFDKDRALDEVSRVLRPNGVFRLNNIEPGAARGWWLYEFFPEAIAIDAGRFWPAEKIVEALEARDFTVEIERESEATEIPGHVAVAEAERRVVSQLAEMDDDAYDRRLSTLRQAVARGRATLTTVNARLSVTARRSD